MKAEVRGQRAEVRPKYERTDETMIRPLILNSSRLSAFDAARAFYEQHSELDFADDLLEYARNGFVVIRPNLFVIGKIINVGRNGTRQPAWFVRCAVGHVAELLTTMPVYLPWIAFCRNNDHKVRVCSTERMAQLAAAMIKKQEGK
jgi:hypothetical protein